MLDAGTSVHISASDVPLNAFQAAAEVVRQRARRRVGWPAFCCIKQRGRVGLDGQNTELGRIAWRTRDDCGHGVETNETGTEAHDAVLLQTSALRLSAEALAVDPRDEPWLAEIVRAGRALNGALRHPGLDVLLEGGDVLEKMALLGRTLSADDVEAATDVFRSLSAAVGILEQSLDAVLVGAPAEQLEDYGDAMLDAFPARWRPYIEPEDEDAEPEEGERPEPPRLADAPAIEEPSFETSFLGEVLDRLAACEEVALEWRDAETARADLPAIEGNLETIEEAFSAIGLRAPTLSEARTILSSIDMGAQKFEPRALAEMLLEVVAWARCQAARACEIAAFVTDLVPDLRPERLCVAPAAKDDASSVDVAGLLGRLRRPLRAAAAACGRWADVDSSSPALRLDRTVAERVTRALSVLLRSGFEERGGEVARSSQLRILRVRVESWAAAELVVVVDESSGVAAASGDDEGEGDTQPEALHGIDVTHEPTPEDLERLVYRRGFANVVVMVVPEGSLAEGGPSS